MATAKAVARKSTGGKTPLKKSTKTVKRPSGVGTRGEINRSIIIFPKITEPRGAASLTD